jgi:hypothetical protein
MASKSPKEPVADEHVTDSRPAAGSPTPSPRGYLVKHRGVEASAHFVDAATAADAIRAYNGDRTQYGPNELDVRPAE